MMIAGSRPGSRHTVQGSAVSTLPQVRQTTMRSLATLRASESGPSSCSRFLMRCSAARLAERGPRPGRRARSWIRRSISGPATDWGTRTSEQLQSRRQRQAFRALLHLLLGGAVGLLAGVVQGRDDEILDDLGLVRDEERRVDAQALRLPLGGEDDPHHAAAGRALDLEAVELFLHGLHLLLHGLRLLHDPHQVAHSNLLSRGLVVPEAAGRGYPGPIAPARGVDPGSSLRFGRDDPQVMAPHPPPDRP